MAAYPYGVPRSVQRRENMRRAAETRDFIAADKKNIRHRERRS